MYIYIYCTEMKICSLKLLMKFSFQGSSDQADQAVLNHQICNPILPIRTYSRNNLDPPKIKKKQSWGVLLPSTRSSGLTCLLGRQTGKQANSAHNPVTSLSIYCIGNEEYHLLITNDAGKPPDLLLKPPRSIGRSPGGFSTRPLLSLTTLQWGIKKIISTKTIYAAI